MEWTSALTILMCMVTIAFIDMISEIINDDVITVFIFIPNTIKTVNFLKTRKGGKRRRNKGNYGRLLSL
jgi:hypothetical protein